MGLLLHIGVAGIWLQQEPDSLSAVNTKLLMIFVAMVAIAMIAQAIALIIMAAGAAKARRRGLEIAEEIRLKLMPIIDATQQAIHDTAPKVKVITENLVETSHVIRAKAQEFDATASDLNRKTRAQMARVDGIVTSALNSAAEISETIQRGIKVPVREFSGLVNGLKAGVDVLVGRARGFTARGKSPRDPGVGW